MTVFVYSRTPIIRAIDYPLLKFYRNKVIVNHSTETFAAMELT